MIGVGAPFILGASVLGALVTCVLHFLSVRRPPVLLLPTMRFLPERPVRAVSRSTRPSDLWLLFIRVAALLFAGVALSGITWRGTGTKHGRIVVVEQHGARDVATLRAQIASAIEGGFTSDTVMRIVVIDSMTHLLDDSQSRAFRAETLSAQPNALRESETLSAAILAATRAAGALVREERTVDAIDLVIAGPMLQSSLDAALPAVRAAWPGAVRFVDTRNSSGIIDSLTTVPDKRAVTLVGAAPSDAVRSAFEVRNWLSGTRRGGVTNSAVAPPPSGDLVDADSTRVNAPSVEKGPISIEWPASGMPQGWMTSAPSIIGALVARGEALVFPFVRTARAPEAVLAQGRAIAWWSDGEVAAIEIPTATSCTRHVGVNVPASSDLLQGQSARALLLALSAPCGGEVDASPIPAEKLKVLEGSGSTPAAAFKSTSAVRTPWASLLLLLALALLGIEWFVRDREDRLSRATDVGDTALRKVA